MLKPEEINGKMYQPVEVSKDRDACKFCVFSRDFGLDECEIKCLPGERDDKLNVYYINIEGE